MAHSTMHFAVGLAAGTCILLPQVLAKIKAGEKTCKAIEKLLTCAYILAGFSVIPNILRHSGFPDSFCSGWWMNIFLLNPLLDKLKPGGMLIGEILIVLFFVLHYSIIIAALLRNRSRSVKIKT